MIRFHKAIADTTTLAGRMVLTVFAGIAEFERTLIIDRSRQGREGARREVWPPPYLVSIARPSIGHWRTARK